MFLLFAKSFLVSSAMFSLIFFTSIIAWVVILAIPTSVLFTMSWLKFWCVTGDMLTSSLHVVFNSNNRICKTTLLTLKDYCPVLQFSLESFDHVRCVRTPKNPQRSSLEEVSYQP